MKLTKAEKIWLIAVIAFYILYNLPFIPGYDNARGTLIHGALTLIPLWISIYVGLVVTCRQKKLKDTSSATEE